MVRLIFYYFFIAYLLIATVCREGYKSVVKITRWGIKKV